MATVFMKWLESRPLDYDRGIRLLTLGRLELLQAQIVDRLVREGMRVLEIGCGTGRLTIAMAEKGVLVTAIDISPTMLTEAERRVNQLELEERINLKLMDASLIGDRFEAGYFDLVVSSLVFSEMTPQMRILVLQECRRLLVPDGKLAIIDETLPDNHATRLIFGAIRLPLRLLTWLLTRTTTHHLRDFASMLSNAGFSEEIVISHLGGSLQLVIASPADGAGIYILPATVLGRLRHRTTLRTLLLDLWATFLRILPPYPKVTPGLYVVGQPDMDSPVLITGNFELTVRRLVREIDNRIDAWVLVVDSAGINVWCAAGGGFFTAEKVIGALRVSGLEGIVRHRALILPQLCANGVDGWRIQQETDWDVHWGPVRAEDIPEYVVSGRVKTDAMRWAKFPLKDRLEMVTVTLGFYGLLIMLPVAVFWRNMFWPVLVSLVGLSYFYAVVLPWLPGRDGLAKSFSLTLISLAGLLVYIVIWDSLPGEYIFNWVLGLTALSVFTAAELQGMSPLMRGEQANWGWEAVIGAVLGLIYWLIPYTLGWR